MYKDYAGKHKIDMYAELMKCIRSGEEKEFPEQKYGDRVLSITISPFPKGAVIISEDITERKRVEEALRESKEFAENLIASMLDGISVLDSDGVHIDVNATLCQMTGFSREELIGVGLPHPYWPPEAYEEIETAFQKTLRGDFSDVELAFMRKNGERFPVIVSPSWIKDKQGNVISYFATVKDITERKRAEEEKRRLEERSRKVVEDIFRFIPEGVLVFSRKMELLRQNQAFRELVSGYAGRLGFDEDELENLIIDKIKAGLGDKNIKEIRISRKHETGK
jgi:PAS domain S-box-containing protein